jgi:hypothetical protein
MPYNYASLDQVVTQLSQRLYLNQALFAGSPNSQFWTWTELFLYVIESLRTFNAFANLWKEEFQFPTVQDQRWYDLTEVPNSLRPFTVTDVDLFKLMEYHLLEPATGATWTGSTQFSIADLLNALQRRRDEILGVSGCTITQGLVPALPGRTFLNDRTIDIRRVAWLPVASPAGYLPTPLWSGDAFEAQSYDPGYPQEPAGSPSVFMRSSQPSLGFDVDIQPAVPGQYDVLTVEAGADLDAANPTVLPIPDDWTWLAKFAALADLTGRESNAKDPLRSRYCEARYRHGLALLATAPAVLVARINDVPVGVDPVQSADDYEPTWQQGASGSPDSLFVAGLNTIALKATPDAGPYAVTVSVVRNAPVPSGGGDPIQIPREDYDVILDYAQHLAAFKMGGAEFVATMPLLDRFIKAAAVYNAKLTEFGPFTETMLGTSQLQEERSPRLSPVVSQKGESL